MDFKDGNISLGRLLYRVSGGIAAYGTPGLIIAAGGSTGVGLIAGVLVGGLWAGGEYLYDEYIESKVIALLIETVGGALNDLERDMRNWRPN